MGPFFGSNLVPILAIFLNNLQLSVTIGRPYKHTKVDEMHKLMRTYFSVQSPPYIVKQPPTKEVYFMVKTHPDENEKPFVIQCEAEGEPAPM